MSETLFKIARTHGLSIALMLGGLYFLNGKLNNAENRIFALENRLYDCYEERIIRKTTQIPTKQDSKPNTFCLLPEQHLKRKKYNNVTI